MSRILRTFLLVGGLASLCSCSSDVGTPVAGDRVSGSFELYRYNNSALPADLGPIGPRTVADSLRCHAHVTGGSLLLRGPESVFVYQYDVRNSCDQRLLSQPVGVGTYSQEGAVLKFVLAAQDIATSFTGHIAPDYILLEQPGLLLEFSR